MRVRMKFCKNGAMRFVGHLDLMRYFQKAMRRAGLDLVYTEGYHPHPILSFAAPLGIGLTSDGEYLDVELGSMDSITVTIETLNREMADGILVTECTLLPEKAQNAMAAVEAADYLVYFKHAETLTQQEIAGGVQAYYEEREAIPVAKQSKKGERVIDLKPYLYRMEAYEDAKVSTVTVSPYASGIGEGLPSVLPYDHSGESSLVSSRKASFVPPCEPEFVLSDLGTRKGFFLRLSAGSAENIKPELVLEDFFHFLGKDYDPNNLQIHRLELFKKVGVEFQPLSFFLY